jgi:hypothetical protein
MQSLGQKSWQYPQPLQSSDFTMILPLAIGV